MPKSRAEPLSSLLSKRLSRRRVLRSGAELAALGIAFGRSGQAQQAEIELPGFAAIVPSSADDIVVPSGYRVDVVLRWGDPLFSGVPSLDATRVARGGLFDPAAAEQQSRQFGYNCDGMAVFERAGRHIACINHEFPTAPLLFPGFREAVRARESAAFMRSHESAVAFMQAAVGVSVVELARTPRWHAVLDSPYNRRITATTLMELSGPAAGHPLLQTRLDPDGTRAHGTFANCAGGRTPWGTYLTAEENVDDFFGNAQAAELSPALAAAYQRFRPRGRESLYRWEFVDPRFDVAVTPAESLRFGWIVEIDPTNPGRPVKKRTALGRMKHEGATFTVAPDGRAVIYMGDDEGFEYLYRFVSEDRVAAEPDRNGDLLDRGVLQVARFDADGQGEWLPLVYDPKGPLAPQAGFTSQGDVVLRCREAADRLGATPLDRCEDVAVSPLTGKVYIACSQNAERGSSEVAASNRSVAHGTDAANPRAPNRWGHIIELLPAGDDPTARHFVWEIFLLAGDPSEGPLLTRDELGAGLPVDATYFAGQRDPARLSAFAGPDNLGFDRQGRLWIVTDAAQPEGHNNGCFVCPTEGRARGELRQFLCGPIGAEISGCEFAEDDRTLFLTVQHPGEGGTATEPRSAWPDGEGSAPRPSLIAVTHTDPRREIGS